MIPTVNLKLERIHIKPRARKIDPGWTIELSQDIESWILVDDVLVRDYDSPMYKALTTPITLP